MSFSYFTEILIKFLLNVAIYDFHDMNQPLL